MRKLFIMLGLCLSLLTPFLAEAGTSEWLYDAELQFVDAVDSTGYYVDMNSITIANPLEASARVAIIRADENRMFLYTTKFNRKLESYQILHSVILEYDSKRTLSVNEKPMAPIKYQAKSPMANIVEFIYNPKQ